ncbi:sensor histidine kinase [Streptomyces mirabilis]|uniref:sensor histidine kinase n=1 Tax=Streptomyces mirabilis TaxID=68239 RepID=UPI0036AA74E4
MPLRSPMAALARARLRTRLLLTYAFVLVINVVTFALAVHFLAPVGATAPTVISTPEAMLRFRAELDEGLVAAVIVGTTLSLATGAIAAVLLSRLIVRPIEHMRAAARYMAEGHYDTRVPLPGPPELSGIADDLNTLAGRLDETEKRRVRLVSDLAHELRTPLTILRGQLDGLAEGLYEQSPELIGSMGEEVERLRRLSDELSHLSRAEEDAYQVQLRETDLADVARDVVDRLHPDFEQNRVALSVTGVAPVQAPADPDRVSQILVNLLTNALAACDSGGRVTVSLSREDDHAVLRVSDTGRGIEPDDLDLIFERFERRTPPGRPAPHQGSGIGLTIARALAHAHGGTLTAYSPGPGRGAVFTLTLPGPTRTA